MHFIPTTFFCFWGPNYSASKLSMQPQFQHSSLIFGGPVPSLSATPMAPVPALPGGQLSRPLVRASGPTFLTDPHGPGYSGLNRIPRVLLSALPTTPQCPALLTSPQGPCSSAPHCSPEPKGPAFPTTPRARGQAFLPIT